MSRPFYLDENDWKTEIFEVEIPQNIDEGEYWIYCGVFYNNGNDFIVRENRDPQSLSDGTIEPVPPPAPIDFTVSDPNKDGSLRLSWTPDTYSEGTYDYFKIYRGEDPSNITYYDSTSDSTTLVYWDYSVTAGVTYYYQVSAVAVHSEITNEGEKTDIASAYATDNVPPSVPTGLSALDTGKGNEIQLTWTPSSSDDVFLYRIGYKDSYFPTFDTFGVSTYTISAWSGAEKSSWTVVTGLTDGVTYYFRISAIDKNENESTLSSTATACSTDITPPEKVVINNIENEGSGTAINLYWTKYSPEKDVVGYHIWYDTVNYSSTGDAKLWGTVQGKDNKSKTVTGLTEGVTYYFAITAFDEVPNEETNVSGYTINAYPTNTPPQEITTLTALNEGTGEKISLSWTPSTESDVTGYNIYSARFSTLTKTNYEYKTFVSTPSSSKVITGLTNFVTYFFKISVLDSGGQEGVLSSTVSAVPSDITPPSPPSNIKIQEPPYSDYPEGGVLKLNWENPSEIDFSSVTIYRSVSTTTILDNPILLTSATFYTDTELQNGVTYYYTIRSMDNYGNESQNVDYYYKRPRDSTIPSSVTLSGFDMGNGSEVYLSWDISSETDFKCYVLERDSSIITAISTRNTSFYIDTVSPDATYYYEISVKDTSDNISPSSSKNIFVMDVSVLPPSDISISAPSSGRKIKLNWKNPPELKGIRIYRSLSSATVFSVIISTLIPPTTYYTDKNLTDAVTYWYGVRAINYLEGREFFYIEESTNTDVYCEIPQDTLKPQTPQNFKITISTKSSSFLLTWEKVILNENGSTCDDLAGYEIWWTYTGTFIDDDLYKIFPSSNDVSAVHSNLSEGTTYYYKIRAKDVAGNFSAFSSTFSRCYQKIVEVAVKSDDIIVSEFTPNGDGIADTLEISFDLNEPSNSVEVSIYTSTGGVYEVIFSSSSLPQGNYSVSWSPTEISDGSYFIKVFISSTEVFSKKILVKGALQPVEEFNNFPNPFIISKHGNTNLRFKLPQPVNLKIAIFNSVGMLVKTWKIKASELSTYENPSDSGYYQIPWDGKNDSGHRVSSGVYIYHFKAGSFTKKGKIICDDCCKARLKDGSCQKRECGFYVPPGKP